MRQAENDNSDFRFDERSEFPASRTALFLPSAVIAGGYLALLVGLVALDRSNGALVRLCIAVLALVVPLLLAHAALRLFTINLRLLHDAVVVHPGFPRREPYEIPLPVIRNLKVRRGFGGIFSGSGTLIFELVTGQHIAIRDLADPLRAKSAVERLLDSGFGHAEQRGLDARFHAGAMHSG